MAGIITEKSALAENLSVIRRAEPTESEKKKVRVAAYCRVSKDIEEQKTSIQTQMESYDRIIREHPGWELAGIYADKGKTGTIRAKRPQFQKMIEDAKAGKIDMILAKSASRFARNTVDLLSVTRELKDIGVGVFFEKEKVNTLSLQSEMLLTVYAAFAQEESRSISENMKRGIRQRFEIGIPKFTVIYGLKLNGKDDWGIIEDEAEVIRKIYDLTIQGYGGEVIADILNEKGIPGPDHTGKKGNWYGNTVKAILGNEKYIGDVCMQKYYTRNHLTHENVRNTEAKVQQYYAKEHHPAIVSRETFEEAKRITLMRDAHRGAVQYPYYGKLLCPYCGKPMVRIPIPTGRNPSGWVCGGDDKGTLYTERTSCSPYWVKEPYLTEAVRTAILGINCSDLAVKDAKTVKTVQDEMKTRETVEIRDLNALVQSMTFPDWDTLEVTWLWGEKSCVLYSVERPTEYPNPKIEWKDGGYVVGSIEIGRNQFKNVERALGKCIGLVKNTQIISDTERENEWPPIVKKAEKVREHLPQTGGLADEDSED